MKGFVKKFTCCVLAIISIFCFSACTSSCASSFDILKYTYELYQGVYTSEKDNTIFSFAKNSSAILCIKSIPYKLNAVNNTENEFNFNAKKMESSNQTNVFSVSAFEQNNYEQNSNAQDYLEDTEINVVFYDGGATITGNFYGDTISIEVKVVKNVTLESGVWKCFNKDNPNISAINSYIIVNEQGETYYVSDASNCYELLYLSVNGEEYTVILDNYGMPSEFITVERLGVEQFGFEVIKFISHIGNQDRYYKLMDNSEKLNFQGENFNAKYIKAQKTVEYLGQNEMANYLPIKWLAFREQEFDRKIIDMSANMELSGDGLVNLTINESGSISNYEGKWCTTDKHIVVILNEYSIIGKTFVLFNNNVQKSFGDNAKSSITIHNVFKIGLTDFHYFLTTTYYTVFWGDEFTEKDLNNTLVYETEYVLTGYYYKWYYNQTLPFSYETATLPESGKVKMILHKDNTVDIIYEDDVQNRRYFTCVLEGTDVLEISLSKKINLKLDEDENIGIKDLYLEDGVLRAGSLSYHSEYGVIENHLIYFVR